MQEDLQKVLSIKPCRVSRKDYLEPLAKKLKIIPEKYKNRTSLHKAICEKLQQPSQRCVNSCDPITLEDIDSISANLLFEWDQNGKHYGADIRSLKAMVEKDSTILPWSIDEASGIQSAQNHDAYVQKYDMKNVPGLIQKITDYKEYKTQMSLTLQSLISRKLNIS